MKYKHIELHRRRRLMLCKNKIYFLVKKMEKFKLAKIQS